MTPAERTELGFITVTQAVNLDILETDVANKIDKDGSIAMTNDFNLGGNDIISGGVTLDTSTSPNNLIVNTTDGVAFDTPLEAKYSFLRNNNPLLVVDGPANRVDVSAGISTRVSGGLDMNSTNITNAANITNTASTNFIDMSTDIRATSTTGEIILDNNSVANSLSLGNTGVTLIANTGNVDLKSVSGEINALSNLDMNSNNIDNIVELIDTNGNNRINMADAGFFNVINISSSGNGIILQETTSTNNIGFTAASGGMAVAVGDLQLRNADPAGSLNIVKQFGGNINLDNQSSGVVVVNNSNLDMNNNGIDNVSAINGLTAVGGIYAGISDGTVINNTTEQSVLPATGVGSLTIPANGFAVGDCFHCVVAGDCSFDKDDTIQIKLKENGNILAQTPIFDLEDAQAGGNAFEIEIDFTIRSLGATGSIATNFDFTYNKDGTDSKDFRGTRAMDVQPIDTTVASTLDITVQFPTNVTPSSLQTKLFRLQKVY
jgi:hypothetical protein